MSEKNHAENSNETPKLSWLEEHLLKKEVQQYSDEEKFSFKEEEKKTEEVAQNSQTLDKKEDVLTEKIEESQIEEKEELSNPEIVSITEEIVKQPIEEQKIEQPKIEETKIETLNIETQKVEELKIEETKIETQKIEEIKVEIPKENKTFETKDAEIPKNTKKTSSLWNKIIPFRAKIASVLNKPIWKGKTIKQTLPIVMGVFVFLFLAWHWRNLFVNESTIPQIVEVKNNYVSDVPITKVIDPQNLKEEKIIKKNNNTNNNNSEVDLNSKYYRVKSGDRFNGIARKFNLSPGELQELNPKIKPERIQPGQKLRVKKD